MRAQLSIITLAGILGGCTADAVATSEQEVIGGALTPAGLYPATGALVTTYQGQQIVFCTGTLIAPDAVVTAAHCVIPPPQIGDFTPYFTLALDAEHTPISQMTPGREKHAHPQYDPNSDPPGSLAHAYDIGIVLLQHAVPGATPAYLPTPQEVATLAQGMSLEITGYGQTSGADQNSGGTKYNATTTLAAVGPYEIQVGAAGMPQNCHGDSGGPAYIHVGSGLRMVGVVSRGLTGGEDTCDIGGIDTRADVYRQWLETYTTLATPPADPGTPPDGGGSGTGSGSGSGSGSGQDPQDPGQDPGASGGCSTGGATSALVALALLGVRRRRGRS